MDVLYHLCRRFKKTDVVLSRNALSPLLAHLECILRIQVDIQFEQISKVELHNVIFGYSPPAYPPCLPCCPRSFSQRLRWRAHLIVNEGQC